MMIRATLYISASLYSRKRTVAFQNFATIGIERLEQGGNAMSINWFTDADEALAQAKEQNKPLLIDFSAAPA